MLRVWNKSFLLEYAGKEITHPSFSYQDQPQFWKNVAEGLRKDFRTIHIDEVLIEDVRHLMEDFNVRFICRRMAWYTLALISGRKPYSKLPSGALVNVAVLASILPLIATLLLLVVFLHPHAMIYI